MSKKKIGVGITVARQVILENSLAYKSLQRLKESKEYTIEFIFSKGPLIDRNRNELIKKALQQKFDYLLQVDCDIAFTNKDIEIALKHDKAIVCLGYKKDHENLSGGFLTEGKVKYLSVEDKGLKDVGFVPGGFLLCKMEVFKKLKDPWYGRPLINGVYAGEDIDFSLKASKIYTLYYDCDNKVKHNCLLDEIKYIDVVHDTNTFFSKSQSLVLNTLDKICKTCCFDMMTTALILSLKKEIQGAFGNLLHQKDSIIKKYSKGKSLKLNTENGTKALKDIEKALSARLIINSLVNGLKPPEELKLTPEEYECTMPFILWDLHNG